MEVKAKARFIRMSPQKVRLVVDLIRGKKVSQALDIAEFSNKWAKRPVIKLLQSAIANAKHNFNLEESNLFIKEIRVDGGPMLKRWTPKAHGRATTVRKRTSHIEIVLGETVETKKIDDKKKVVKTEANDKKTVKDTPTNKIVKKVKKEEIIKK